MIIDGRKISDSTKDSGKNFWLAMHPFMPACKYVHWYNKISCRFIYTCMHACRNAYMHACRNPYMHACRNAYMHACICILLAIHPFIPACKYVHNDIITSRLFIGIIKFQIAFIYAQVYLKIMHACKHACI